MDKYWAHSFTDLTPADGCCIAYAELQIRIATSSSFNDKIRIGFIDSSADGWDYSIGLADLHCCGGPINANETKELALSLSDLHKNAPLDNVNLLAGIAENGYLDVAVSDDSMVEFAKLYILYEPCCDAGAGTCDCIDFEDLLAGSTYAGGDTFLDSGALFTVAPLLDAYPIPQEWIYGGHATIAPSSLIEGRGKEVSFTNAALNLAFAAPVQSVEFLFGGTGANLNIGVNGVRKAIVHADAACALPSFPVGGANVSFVCPSQGQRSVKITADTAPMMSLIVGGDGLSIDSILVCEAPEPSIAGAWIMPWSVGSTWVTEIKTNGRVTYTDSGTGVDMEDAPFGGRLGLQIRNSDSIFANGIKYYRLRYLHEDVAGSDWEDFTEPIIVHYYEDIQGQLVLMPFSLGPTLIDGMNLYRFRPTVTELSNLVNTTNQVYWPSQPSSSDRYRGVLDTAALGLAPGDYRIRLEVYNGDDPPSPVLPGVNTFEFRVPTGNVGTVVQTDVVTSNTWPGLYGGGVEFRLRIDNRKCVADILPPQILMSSSSVYTSSGPCGFLNYSDAGNDLVKLAFVASHPGGEALFRFRTLRGSALVSDASITSFEPVGVDPVGTEFEFAAGEFTGEFFVEDLLGTCLGQGEAAFVEILKVYAKATTGWGHRISGLDGYEINPFALTED
jgi:hypothetical protein